MDEMLERVARAIITSATEGAEPEARAAFIERHWREHLKGAQAAIDAMEPFIEARIDRIHDAYQYEQR